MKNPCCLLRCNKKDKPIKPIPASVDMDDILLCSTTTSIIAVDKRDGSIFWKTTSPIGSSGGILSILIMDEGRALLGARGRTACIDIRTSDLLWKQKMPRRWLCNEVGVNVNRGATKDISSKSHNSSRRPHTMLAATWGRVFAFDPETGDLLWRFNCPKGRVGFPMTLMDDGSIFIGCNTMLYSLNPITGQLQWSTQLVKRPFSLANYVTLATLSGGSSGDAVPSNGQPIVHISDLETKVLITIRIVIMAIIYSARYAS